MRWLLPDGVEELLPPAAARLESLRRAMLDLLGSWGYELVMPPMLEYIESLLTGFGSDLDLQTLKVIDLLTGRLMGLRADVTKKFSGSVPFIRLLRSTIVVAALYLSP